MINTKSKDLGSQHVSPQVYQELGLVKVNFHFDIIAYEKPMFKINANFLTALYL